jgi:oxygen-dependent protoporphyrinogen oxidase
MCEKEEKMSSHIVVLGAGISGLATAWFLKQSFGSQIHISVIEKSERAGGWIQTIQKEGFLFEQGPRSCRTKGIGRETLALIETLDLQDQVIFPHPDARHRYIYDQKGLQRLPRHIGEIPFNPLTQGWLQALWRDWRTSKRQENDDESIQAFFTRRLGQAWVDRFIDPFVLGIYAGDCSRLSLKSCFPLFNQWEQVHGSLLRGAWNHRPTSSTAPQSLFVQHTRRFSMFSFKQGMETLPNTLAHHLKDSLFLNQTARSLEFDANHIVIHLENGQQMKADKVISTLPAYALASLINRNPLSVKLKELSYATVLVINVGFEASVLPFKGFGYLVPSKIGLPILGCVWDSCIFPQQNGGKNQTRLGVMMGGVQHPEIEGMSEHEVLEYVVRVLHQHLGIRSNPQTIQINKAQRAIPQYEIGYSIWKQDLQKVMSALSPHLILSGSAWEGVSINDCIVQARHVAQFCSTEHMTT